MNFLDRNQSELAMLPCIAGAIHESPLPVNPRRARGKTQDLARGRDEHVPPTLSGPFMNCPYQCTASRGRGKTQCRLTRWNASLQRTPWKASLQGTRWRASLVGWRVGFHLGRPACSRDGLEGAVSPGSWKSCGEGLFQSLGRCYCPRDLGPAQRVVCHRMGGAVPTGKVL